MKEISGKVFLQKFFFLFALPCVYFSEGQKQQHMLRVMNHQKTEMLQK